MVVSKLNTLRELLTSMERVTVAVSGGVDSMTLAYVAHQALGNNATMVHATSPAVPQDDTAKIQQYAADQGWKLTFIQTGEFEDSNYLSNPVNRCYFCKNCLYSSLKKLKHGQVVSGTNTDDLGDYRPGLIAAKEQDIRHPFVEAGIDKQTIRDIAAHLGLKELSVKPSSPCLASRVETGVRIEPNQLGLIYDIETKVRTLVAAENIRCRITANHLELQIDDAVLKGLSNRMLDTVETQVQGIATNANINIPVTIGPYVRGSAFLKDAILRDKPNE